MLRTGKRFEHLLYSLKVIQKDKVNEVFFQRRRIEAGSRAVDTRGRDY